MRYNHLLTFCLNIQQRNVMGVAILNYRNDIILNEQYDISQKHGIREIVTYAYEIFLQKRNLPEFTDTKFIGVGVIVSGIFDKHTKVIINAAIPFLEDAPVKAVVEEIFGMPCYVDNESNLCAISVQQAYPDMSDFLYMHISQGVGIGIIANGALLSGYDGYAAEIAHLPFGNPNRRCPICKSYGCLEPELSLSGLLHNGIWRDTYASDKEQWSQMVKLIQAGDPKYADFLREKGALIGKVLYVLIDLFNPQSVFIGGDIVDIFEQLRPYAKEVIQNHCFMIRDRILPIQCDNQSSVSMILGLNHAMCEKWEPLNGALY